LCKSKGLNRKILTQVSLSAQTKPKGLDLFCHHVEVTAMRPAKDEQFLQFLEARDGNSKVEKISVLRNKSRSLA